MGVVRTDERERRVWRGGCAGFVDAARGTRSDVTDVARLVETRGDGSGVLVEVAGGGGDGTAREEFARAVERERVLSEIR